MQRLKRLLSTGMVLLLLISAGCVTLPKSERASVYCKQGDDCDVKWGRAVAWISQNSHWKTRIQTDLLMETEGHLSTEFPAYVVNKIPLSDRKYAISVRLSCEPTSTFPPRCIPDLAWLKSSFVQYVDIPSETSDKNQQPDSENTSGRKPIVPRL